MQGIMGSWNCTGRGGFDEKGVQALLGRLTEPKRYEDI